MTRILILLAAALAVPGLPAAAQQERTPPFLLAVLRRDALAVPFAYFTGSRWRTPWPAGTTQDRPIALKDVPNSWWGVDEPPARMALWREGTRAGEVELTGVTTLPLMCAMRTVLTTDYKPSMPPPPPIERPYPKDGLLISAEVPVRAISIVDPAGPEAQGLLPLLTRDFDEQESVAAGRFSAWRHPFSRDERRKLPITLEAVYRADADEAGWTAYYVEAVRQFPPDENSADGCGLVTFGYGWLMRGPKGEVRTRMGAVVTYCDRKDVAYMLPLGLITDRDRTYWVYQLSGFGAEVYEVVRPTRRGIERQAQYEVGLCPQ